MGVEPHFTDHAARLIDAAVRRGCYPLYHRPQLGRRCNCVLCVVVAELEHQRDGSHDDFFPSQRPAQGTDQAAGTKEKGDVMMTRIEQHQAACHPRDPQALPVPPPDSLPQLPDSPAQRQEDWEYGECAYQLGWTPSPEQLKNPDGTRNLAAERFGWAVPGSHREDDGHARR